MCLILAICLSFYPSGWHWAYSYLSVDVYGVRGAAEKCCETLSVKGNTLQKRMAVNWGEGFELSPLEMGTNRHTLFRKLYTAGKYIYNQKWFRNLIREHERGRERKTKHRTNISVISQSAEWIWSHWYVEALVNLQFKLILGNILTKLDKIFKSQLLMMENIHFFYDILDTRNVPFIEKYSVFLFFFLETKYFKYNMAASEITYSLE